MSTSALPVRVNAAEEIPAAPSTSGMPWRTTVSVVLAAAAILLAWAELVSRRVEPMPIVYGFMAVALLYVLSVWVTGRPGPFQAALGTDGRLSTSKFQFLLWTAVVVFTYSWLYAARASAGNWEVISDLPANVLLAMGISAGTLAAAKGITTSYLRSGLIDKPSQPAGEAAASDLVANDNEAPDLTKIQMLVWTFVAAAVYLAQVAISWREHAVCAPGACEFPDIDAALMVLMGLGQGAYLGNKLVTINTPRLTSSEPATGAWGTEVTIRGDAFGASPQWVTVNDVPVPVDAAKWKDNEVVVAIPRRRPSDGGEWSFNAPMQIGLTVNGRRGVGSAPFQIAPPVIESAEAAKAEGAGTKVTLEGSAFGPRQDDSAVLLGDAGEPAVVSSWSDRQIALELPGARWPAGSVVRVRIRMYGQTAPSEKSITIPA